MTADVLALLRVLLSFGVAFVVLPAIVLPRPGGARSRLDVVAINLVRWIAVVIVVSHVLAAAKVYGIVSLSASFLAIGWYTRYRKQWGGFAGLLHMLWPSGAIPGQEVPLNPDGTPVGKAKAPGRVRRLLALLGLSLPVLGVVGVSFWLRLEPALSHVTLSPPDAYVHMAWADAFQKNVLWPDGVYPLGLAAFVSLIDVFSPFTDIVHVARFTGPIVGMLLVFSIYYAVVRLTRNPGAALLAAGTIGLFGARPEWREPWHRLIGLVPQELGVALAVFALAFAVLAVTERGGGERVKVTRVGSISLGGHTLSVFAAAFAAAMTHLVPGAFLVLLVSVGAWMAALAMPRGGLSRAVGVSVAAGSGVVAGFAVVPLAQLLGWEAYLGYGAGEAAADLGVSSDLASAQRELVRWFGDLEALGHNPLSTIAGISVLLGIAAAVTLFLLRRDRTLTAQLLGLTAAAGLLVALFDLTPLAYRVDAFYLVRLANLIGALLALAFGVGLGWLGALLGRVRVLGGVAAMLVLGIVALAGFGWRFPAVADVEEREQLVYEQSARVLLDLKSSEDAGAYTVVGTPAEEQFLAGHGFFIAAWVFARDIGGVGADEVIPIPTATTYIFAEKVPFPVRPIDPIGPSEEYYFDPVKRARIMAILTGWARSYDSAHSAIEIHYEDDEIVVFALRRNPAISIDDDAEEFTDYRWRPGELFTEGPTSPEELLPAGAGESVSTEEEPEESAA